MYVYGLHKHTLLCTLYIFIQPFNSYENYIYGISSSHEYMQANNKNKTKYTNMMKRVVVNVFLFRE